MSHFDQRGQRVERQVNVAGNVYQAGGDITQVSGDAAAVVEALDGLLRQVQAAAASGALDADTAEDAGHALKKAAIEAGKPAPDKSRCLEYLGKAKEMLEAAGSVSASVGALAAGAAAAYAKLKGWLGS